MGERQGVEEEQVLKKTIYVVNEQGWGIALGLMLGVGLFLATNVLVFRGGPAVGRHLSLLRIYFPGYSVTFVGSLIGFIYAFVLGYGIGRTVVTIYNRLTLGMR